MASSLQLRNTSNNSKKTKNTLKQKLYFKRDIAVMSRFVFFASKNSIFLKVVDLGLILINNITRYPNSLKNPNFGTKRLVRYFASKIQYYSG